VRKSCPHQNDANARCQTRRCAAGKWGKAPERKQKKWLQLIDLEERENVVKKLFGVAYFRASLCWASANAG